MFSGRQNIIAAFFTLAIALPTLVICWMQIHQLIIRHQMMEKLEHAQLQTIVINAGEVKWYKKNKEIIVAGRMFDVKSHKKKGSMIEFTGLFDEKETAIKDKVEKIMKEEQKNKATGKDYIAKFMTGILIFHDNKHSFSPSIFFQRKITTPFYADNVLSVDLAMPSPPPKHS